MSIFNNINVDFDSNSSYKLSELVEREYFTRLIVKLQEIMKLSFENYHFFIFANDISNTFPDSVNFKTKRFKVLIYIGDSFSICPHKYADSYLAIFKTNLSENQIKNNVFPIPLGLPNNTKSYSLIPILERKYDVFFSGDLNKNRIGLYSSLWSDGAIYTEKLKTNKTLRKLMLKAKSDFSHKFPNSIIKFQTGFQQGFSKKKYDSIIYESKIVLSPRGFNLVECFRIYEALKAGCIVISMKLPNIDYFINSSIIQVDNWQIGLNKTRKLLNNGEKLILLHQKSLKDWQVFFSEEAVANLIFSKIDSLATIEELKVST